MRRCPGCGELTDYFDSECWSCRYIDPAWVEVVMNGRKQTNTFDHIHSPEASGRPPEQPSKCSPRLVVIPISSFSDSSELADVYTAKAGTFGTEPLEIRFDFRQLGFDWEASTEGEEHEFIPGSIGVLALTEARRAMRLACQTWGSTRVTALLPPQGHPVSELLREAGMLSDIPSINVKNMQCWKKETRSSPFDARTIDLETIVPFTKIGPATNGQLSDLFYIRFDAMSARGAIGREFCSPLRQVVMNLAENAADYGRGGYIGCFLRQEKGRTAGLKGRFGGSNLFDPRKHTHLFINCFTLGPSLSEVTDHPNEWSAAEAVLGGGFTSRINGGGSGMETIMRTVVEGATGTVYLNSKNYVRVITPDGIVREYNLGGDLYLPGVHICTLIPLAVVAQLYALKSGKGSNRNAIRHQH